MIKHLQEDSLPLGGYALRSAAHSQLPLALQPGGRYSPEAGEEVGIEDLEAIYTNWEAGSLLLGQA